MTLSQELKLNKAIKILQHETIMSVFFTANIIKKRSADFFRAFPDLTDVQFNLLMLLKYQSAPNPGLSQADLSDMMLVNRANITSLVDRMEKTNLVKRTAAEDRRYNIIVLTEKAKRLLEKVEPLYFKEVDRITSALKKTEQKQLVNLLEKTRANV